MLSGVYRFPAMDSVVFGKSFAEALAQEVDRLDARAVFILASGTLTRETDTVDRLRGVLGNHHGYFIRPHHVNFGNKGLGPGGTIGRFPNRRIPGRPRFNSQIFLGGCRFKAMQTEATVN